MIPSRKSKAVGLFSGGLDSILATRLVAEQGVTVVALNFRSPFDVAGQTPSEERLSRMAQLLGASLVSLELGADYLELVRKPALGYVRQMAPCLDCVVHMLVKAKQLAREIHADFVFTGEVVGQRAMCQNKRALRTIERAAGLEGRLLRPLSAKLLEPTIPELTGLVRRERLLDLKGKGRRRQIRLAHEFGIFDYPIPGIGCMLLDKNFAARVRELVEHDQLTPNDIKLLKFGRHFRLDSGAKVIVGRNEQENLALESSAQPDDVICRPVEVMGPTVLIRARKQTKKDAEIAVRIAARFSDASEGKSVKFACGDRTISVKPYSDEELASWRIRYVEPPKPEPPKPADKQKKGK